MKNKEQPSYIIIILVLAIVAAAAFLFLSPKKEADNGSGFCSVSPVHEHADFKVFLNGVPKDFAQEEFMEETDPVGRAKIHMEDGDGNVIHKHANGVTLGYFFSTIGMSFNSTCFVDETGRQFCGGPNGTLKLVVNGAANPAFGDYEIKDEDKVLISFGSETDLSGQLAAITNLACAHSKKCPLPAGMKLPEEGSC